MLELVGGRLGRQDVEALVDSDRVRGHGDRLLPTPAQELGELDRDLRLSHPGGTKDGDQATRATRDSSPASVVEVAPEISTATSSPGRASPVKLTVLLWRVRPRSLAGSVRLGPSTSTSWVVPTNRV